MNRLTTTAVLLALLSLGACGGPDVPGRPVNSGIEATYQALYVDDVVGGGQTMRPAVFDAFGNPLVYFPSR